jgi:HEAT repeat protein
VNKSIVALLAALSLVAAKPAGPTAAQVRAAITPLDKIELANVREMGPGVLPHLVHIYKTSDEDTRSVIAWVFYNLGWKSPEARAALLEDIDTINQKLRLQVQWALGRVSDDTEVVDILAGIMRNDENPLFRDKAACALAYDQIHLTEKQKVALFTKLIDGLSDPKAQVRAISIQALSIHTGQDKGFHPTGLLGQRNQAIAQWKRWLAEYEKNL